MKKKIMAYALATTMIGSFFTISVQAKEQNTESISLPMQLMGSVMNMLYTKEWILLG